MSSGRGSIYDVLGVPKDASGKEIRSAYLKLAVRLHPDRNRSETAADDFRQLQRVYEVLSDEERRALYDETGAIAGEGDDVAPVDADELRRRFRRLYREVTAEAIRSFERGYRGSDEEARTVVAEYRRHGGRMSTVFAFVMCSDERKDSHRFADLLEQAAARGEIELARSFAGWAAEIRKRPRPSDEEVYGAAAGEVTQARATGRGRGRGGGDAAIGDGASASDGGRKGSREGGGGRRSGSDGAAAAPPPSTRPSSSASDLATAIRSRRGADPFAHLLAKYGSGAMAEDEPDDEAFEAARRRLEAARAGGAARQKGAGGEVTGSRAGVRRDGAKAAGKRARRARAASVDGAGGASAENRQPEEKAGGEGAAGGFKRRRAVRDD